MGMICCRNGHVGYSFPKLHDEFGHENHHPCLSHVALEEGLPGGVAFSGAHAVGLGDSSQAGVRASEEGLSACGAQFVGDVLAVAGPQECSASWLVACREPDQPEVVGSRFREVG
jgi:hypothetical protein